MLASEGGAGGDEVGGCALEDDPAAVVTGARAEVDDPVGVRHHRLVVLDDDDRLAGVDEPVEQAEQLLDVGQVEAGGRLVEDVDAALVGHVRGQLEPLPLAAAADAGEVRPDVDAYGLMYAVGNLCVSGDSRYDARRMVGLLIAGLRC